MKAGYVRATQTRRDSIHGGLAAASLLQTVCYDLTYPAFLLHPAGFAAASMRGLLKEYKPAYYKPTSSSIPRIALIYCV